MLKLEKGMLAFLCCLLVQPAIAGQTYTANLENLQFITSVYPAMILVQVVSRNETLGELVFSPNVPAQHVVMRMGTAELKINGFYSTALSTAGQRQASVDVDYQMGHHARLYQGEIARWDLVS